jgi:hypothetical protein
MTIVYGWKRFPAKSQPPWSDAPGPGHAVLAVAGEAHVGRAQRAPGADLRGLLPEQRHPDPQLALALQRVALAVGAADQDQVAVERLQVLDGDIVGVAVEPLVRHPLTLRCQQLDELGTALVDPLQAGDDLVRAGT